VRGEVQDQVQGMENAGVLFGSEMPAPLSLTAAAVSATVPPPSVSVSLLLLSTSEKSSPAPCSSTGDDGWGQERTDWERLA